MGKNLLAIISTIAFSMILTGFFASTVYSFPYWSFVNTHGPRYQGGEEPYSYHFSDYDSGPSYSYSCAGIWVRKTTIDGVTIIHKFVAEPITTALGYAEAYSDPQKGELKLHAYGRVKNEYIHLYICWDGICWTYGPSEVGGGSGRAYARSIWEVKSDTLPIGTSVSMELSISLKGEFSGDRNNDGKADVRMYAWLYTPEIVANVWKSDATPISIMRDLYEDKYPAVYVWWQDLGFNPNLAIYASNYGGIRSFFETQTISFPNTGGGPGGTGPFQGEGNPLILPNGEPPSPIPPSSLTEIKVGDILILELELSGYVSLYNDGSYSEVRADFFNTGTYSFNILTPGVYLAPVPIPSTLILLGTGAVTFALLKRRRKFF